MDAKTTSAWPNTPFASPAPTPRCPKLLIVYASYGEGHLQAARAIAEALELQGIASGCIKLVDLLAESNPLINQVSRRVYHSSYTRMPALYGWVYDRTRPMKHDSLLGGWLHAFGRDKLRRILAAEQPDAVVYTFPMFAASAKRRGSPAHVPTSAVITDFDLHRRWVHPCVDRYYVATEDLKLELISLGIAAQRIIVSGIPIKRGFTGLTADHDYKQADRTALYRRYNLPSERPIVLLMAGAQGVMPDIAAVCDALLQEPNLTIALICGRNAQLAEAMRTRYTAGTSDVPDPDRSPNDIVTRIHIFDYVDTIHELMLLADCLVTKPGGLTLSEGLAAGLPILLYRPVPGQEKNNALYLQNKGAATIASNPDELRRAAAALLHHPQTLLQSRAASRALGRSNAANMIALDILVHCPIMEEASSILQM
ncbi:Monogalactosyldiacylglycerol synthase [Paenibacillus curdlanolyticus YK9]|uniref:Monogalactosyldiacylglycerol synthase n=1 Tax=Paenibacillus curdlanolyticus YK9 TaxID=717606 RepID=E0IB67_9BACL|nr:glycosyltransferase [Paenibacillus curdlanolyticus]EFM10358.1 Monogalactosyldiacylglycerol synthase [Paenibacillus curdlanolyticus YK9]